MTIPDTLGDDLYHYLVDTLYSVPQPRRSRSCWVMSPEWELECRKLSDALGYPVMPPPARFDAQVRLLGLPLMVTEDGGAPHLIAD